MATPTRLQRAAARPKPSPPHGPARVTLPLNNISNARQQQATQPRLPQSQGNQILPLATRPRVAKKKRLLSWLCCGDYGRAAAIWGCLAVLSPVAFFLLDWFKPGDDSYAKATYEEERYQSDIEAKRLCVALKVAQLPSSHLDCDRILALPFPTRPEVLGNAVGQDAGPPRVVRASMLSALMLVRDFLFNDPLSSALVTCVLVAIIAWVMSAERSAKAPTATSRKSEPEPYQAALSKSISADSNKAWHHDEGSDADLSSSSAVEERETKASLQ